MVKAVENPPPDGTHCPGPATSVPPKVSVHGPLRSASATVTRVPAGPEEGDTLSVTASAGEANRATNEVASNVTSKAELNLPPACTRNILINSAAPPLGRWYRAES
jgi:hypothetical protein